CRQIDRGWIHFSEALRGTATPSSAFIFSCSRTTRQAHRIDTGNAKPADALSFVSGTNCHHTREQTRTVSSSGCRHARQECVPLGNHEGSRRRKAKRSAGFTDRSSLRHCRECEERYRHIEEIPCASDATSSIAFRATEFAIGAEEYVVCRALRRRVRGRPDEGLRTAERCCGRCRKG